MNSGEIAKELDEFLNLILVPEKVSRKEARGLIEYLLVEAFWAGRNFRGKLN